MNFAYKLDDREATEKLAENLAESILDGNREAVLKLIGEAEEQIDSLPDSMIGLSELHEAGFYSESMLPLTRERAVELHHEGVTVYGLTGAVSGQEQSQRVMNLELDILQHDGLFGVTKFEWENYRRSQETVMTPEEKAKIKETLLLESDGNRYGIYQINSGQEERGYQFLSLEATKEMGFTVDGKDYQMVYSERLRDATTLDNLFERFNIERPNDFTGHSMSVSDVIIMNRGGRLTAYYVDSFGFTELPDFVAQRAEMLNANPVKAYPEVYMGTLEKAMQERNVDAYLDSRKLNIDCKNAIEQAITENFDGMSLNPDTAIDVIGKYGEERVAFVLANTLKQLSYDGSCLLYTSGIPQAFEERNSAWAEEYTQLKGVLTPEEYSAARASTLNAFYTSPTVIKAMYEALGNMGLKQGNILEPSCGVGNFMGLLPESMSAANMYGVELDPVSGQIAKQLYQKNRIAVQGFEETSYPDSFFDCVIGNVPFGAYQVSDRKYDRYHFTIHDYFIAKSLDLVRPGGVVAVVTSSGTMDKQNPEVRQYFANRADLLGAIRLPNNAFQRNANTSVVADILFFQKRDRAAITEPDWVQLKTTSEGYTVNSYFADHPEMVLGDFTTESTQYGKQEVTVKVKEGADLAEQIKEAVKYIQGTITEQEILDTELEEQVVSIPADPNIKNFSFALVGEDIYYRENSVMNKMELPVVTGERVRGMVAIRDATNRLLERQLEECSDEEVASLQAELNQVYDSFTAKYGLLSSNANKRAFSMDSSYCLLTSLELSLIHISGIRWFSCFCFK